MAKHRKSSSIHVLSVHHSTTTCTILFTGENHCINLNTDSLHVYILQITKYCEVLQMR